MSEARSLSGNKIPVELEIEQRKSMQLAITNHLFKEEFFGIPVKTAVSCRLMLEGWAHGRITKCSQQLGSKMKMQSI